MSHGHGPLHKKPFAPELPARTPGPLGVNDAADPNALAALGDTPGSLGYNDHAAPHKFARFARRPLSRHRRPASPTKPAATPLGKAAVKGWPSRLKWSQFKVVASPPDGSDFPAQTGTQQPEIPAIRVERHGSSFSLGNFTVTVSLDPSQTWIVKGKASDAILHHEQRHWDIAGLAAYEFGRRLESVNAGDVDSLRAALDSLQEEIAIKAQALQDWYDDESQHGVNAKSQKEWDDRIDLSIKNNYAVLPSPSQKYLEQAKRELGK